ncbi:hypothetical protein [Pseudomonas sp. S5D5]|uniref:hypothetical protein n=1 Tax=Pseudomonas sp. S5D5 TaxID=2083056 RepID=UPI000D0FD613|nr:hypothetical protein [Pseudomonas sp. S5D5]
MKLLKLAAILTLPLLGACSDYHYKNYQGDWAPEKLHPVDLSNNAPDAVLVYFDTWRERELGVPFHRLALAVEVDGVTLPGAGRQSILNVSGEQALKLSPGKHSLRWCNVSMNALGTGGAFCNEGADDVEFKAGRRYLVSYRLTASTRGVGPNYSTQYRTHSSIKDLDSQEIIYPSAGTGTLISND